MDCFILLVVVRILEPVYTETTLSTENITNITLHTTSIKLDPSSPINLAILKTTMPSNSTLFVVPPTLSSRQRTPKLTTMVSKNETSSSMSDINISPSVLEDQFELPPATAVSTPCFIYRRKKLIKCPTYNRASVILVAYIIPGAILFGILCYIVYRLTRMKSEEKVKRVLTSRVGTASHKGLVARNNNAYSY